MTIHKSFKVTIHKSFKELVKSIGNSKDIGISLQGERGIELELEKLGERSIELIAYILLPNPKGYSTSSSFSPMVNCMLNINYKKIKKKLINFSIYEPFGDEIILYEESYFEPLQEYNYNNCIIVNKKEFKKYIKLKTVEALK